MRTDIPLGERRFLILAHRAEASGDFSLNDLPGAGRIDAISSAIVSSLLFSNGIRKDASVCITFPEHGWRRCVIFSGSHMKYLNPDERSTAALLRNALVKGSKDMEGASSPGVYFFRAQLVNLLKYMSSDAELFYLNEKGEANTTFNLPALFVLGDVDDPTVEEETIMAQLNARRISISNRSLQTGQCITVLNWLLDNNGKF
jgi:tRNA (pseudouridine54-N1)-methyltransferase